MIVFEDLKSQWKNQSRPEIPDNGPEKIMQRIMFIKKKQQITNVVLSTTAVVLIVFFFYISAYKYSAIAVGLTLMILALVIRVILEILSIRTIKKMDVTTDVANFKERLLRYYGQRRIVHLVVTPIVVITYCVGFVLLLPAFKMNLSSAFYSYILISSLVLLCALGTFVAIQIRNELKELQELNMKT